MNYNRSKWSTATNLAAFNSATTASSSSGKSSSLSATFQVAATRWFIQPQPRSMASKYTTLRAICRRLWISWLWRSLSRIRNGDGPTKNSFRSHVRSTSAVYAWRISTNRASKRYELTQIGSVHTVWANVIAQGAVVRSKSAPPTPIWSHWISKTCYILQRTQPRSLILSTRGAQTP